MGNVLLDNSTRKKADPIVSLDAWLEQSPQLTNRRLLMQNKVFRTMSFMYNSQSQSLLCKAYLKWELTGLEDYRKIFELYKKAIDPLQYHGMMPFLTWRNFDQAKQDFVVVMRQHLATTVEERLTSQPPLTFEEKYWIILQTIISLYGLHIECNLYHGHLRTSNLLLQTNDHVVMTDFACYKPTYMLEDDLGEFRLYYGSSGAKCTLAPQKLISQLQKDKINRSPIQLLNSYKKEAPNKEAYSTGIYSRHSTKDLSSSLHLHKVFSVDTAKSESFTVDNEQQKVSEYTMEVNKLKQMDIFSLGCTILDILLNGKPFMSFQNLLQYKKGQFSLGSTVQAAVEGLQHAQELKVLLLAMLERDPDKRPCIEDILVAWFQFGKKDVWLLLWYVQMAFCKGSFFSADLRIGLIRKVIEKIEKSNPIEERLVPTVDLPLSMQRIGFVRNFLNQIQKGILPNLDRVGLLKTTLLRTMQQDLDREAEEQKPVNLQPDSEDDLMIADVGDKQKDQKFPYTSMDNMRPKKFKKYEKKEETKPPSFLFPIKWSSELEMLQQPKFKGNQLTTDQIGVNMFQQALQNVKKQEQFRDKFIVRKAYIESQQFIKLLFSCIRRAKFTASRMVAIELLYIIGSGVTDRTKIQRVLPYLITLTTDTDVQVASLAFLKSIDIFYTVVQPFSSLEQTKYYKTIVQNFSTLSKSTQLRQLFLQHLPRVYKIIEWLMVHTLKYNPKNINLRDHLALVDAVFKRYGVLNSCEKEILMESISHVWNPNIEPFFVSMLNVEKVSGFREGVRIAEKKLENLRYGFLDACVESGLDESGAAAFYAIRYFRVRQKVNEDLLYKIVPFVVYPHRWIRNEAIAYINMCIEMFPASRLYILFMKLMDSPFPLQPSDIGDLTLLPPMLSSVQVDMREKKVVGDVPINKTVELFKKYLNKSKQAKEFPQIEEEVIKTWRQASKDVISESDEKRNPEVMGEFAVDVLLDMYRTNLLYYLNLVGKAEVVVQDGKGQKQDKGPPAELAQFCQKNYEFSLKGGQVTSGQRLLFNQILEYLNFISQSFLLRHRLISSRSKQLFSDNMLRINSVVMKYESRGILPTMTLGRYFKDQMEQGRFYKPQGILVAQIYQHKDTISCLEKVADRFFITGSYDGTVRFFDSKKMEEDATTDSFGVMDMRQPGDATVARVSSIAAFEETQSVVVGTSKGTLNIYRLENVRDSRNTTSRVSKTNMASIVAPVQKYQVKEEVQKVICFKNELKQNCFSFITSQGNIRVQDVRTKSQCLKCYLGKQRSLPKSLLAVNNGLSLLVGTVGGYIINYDVRCNLVGAVHQLFSETQALPIMSLNIVPSEDEPQELVSVCYPSKNYEFCYFDFNDPRSDRIAPIQLFTSSNQEQIVVTPYLINQTKSESFMNCSNSLSQRSYYKFMPTFFDKIDILEHLKDPLTQKGYLTKERWLSSSKQRYSQITSISNKRYLPFLEYLPSGILTHFNPNINTKNKMYKPAQNLALLNAKQQQVQKKQSKITSPIEKQLKKVSNYWFLPEEQSSDYLTCCKALNNIVVTGGRDSIVRIYR